MPLVRVEVLKGRAPSTRSGILDAVHDALVETLGIPDSDRTQRLVEHEPSNFEMDPGRSGDYVIVEITMFPGRSRSAKEFMFKAIVRNLVRLGVPAHDVTVVLHEPPLENWGIRGGVPADQTDIGFRRDV
jgi:phenylpyruvate tautomerase PptA (4-oxalocrotonate tautomerase family)